MALVYFLKQSPQHGWLATNPCFEFSFTGFSVVQFWVTSETNQSFRSAHSPSLWREIQFFLTKKSCSNFNYLNGLIIARCRSTAMAVNVNTETFTLTVCTNGQNAHMKSGRFHRCNKAAWNCKRENININIQKAYIMLLENCDWATSSLMKFYINQSDYVITSLPKCL